MDFETRVQSVPDSPERGFELALYYAVTHDENVGKQAVIWALGHRCEVRQVALVLDWVSDQVSDSQGNQLVTRGCPPGPSAQASRDALFADIATGEDPSTLLEASSPGVISQLRSDNWQDGGQLYAAIEYLYAAKFSEHTDLREKDAEFFLSLPSALLLSLKPQEVRHPEWHVHAAALALVSLDPNLGGSQFLQGWAIEDSQLLREGPGVAYEFLWADPYLPGVGFENLDPWSYDSDGTLFARTDWTPDACWIHMSRAHLDQVNCAAGWQQKSITFGHLTLFPMPARCVELPNRKPNDSLIIWKLEPEQTLRYALNGNPAGGKADTSGLWKTPGNIEGRVCTSLDTLKIPKAHKSARE